MNGLILILVALLVPAARALYLELDLAGWERLWQGTSGPMAVELCRHAGMSRLQDDSPDAPLPCEFRAVLLRVGGLPVWTRQAIVCLPREVHARIGEVSANEFDHLFSGPFRLSWSRRTMNKLYCARQ